jgi:hypothetical protein
LEEYLDKRGWQKVLERDLRPRKWGAGEVDLLVWDSMRKMLWLIEIKEHRWAFLGERSLISEVQVGRLRRSLSFYRGLYPGYVIGFGLLWRDPDTERLEFLENP